TERRSKPPTTSDSVEQPPDCEKGKRGGRDERQQGSGGRDSLELGVVVAKLDEADRADGHAAAATTALTFAFLAGSGAPTSAESEPGLRNRNHRYARALDGIAEDRRRFRVFANRLRDPLEERVHQL